MSLNDDFIAQLEDYLAAFDGRTPLPDHVRDAIRAELPSARRVQPRTGLMRVFTMLSNTSAGARAGLAAATVVVAVVLGAAVLNNNRTGGVVGGGPTMTIAPTIAPSIAPTTAPTATPAGPTAVPPGPLPSEGVLTGGTYVATPFVGIGAANACWTPPQPGCVETAADDSIRIKFTVPAGWEVDPLRLGVWLTGKHNLPPDGANLFFERGGWLYGDPCHLSAQTAIKVGPSVDDFANAIANHPKLDATKPVPVTLGGYSGRYMDLQIPADISACTDEYWPWEPGFYAQGPSQRWHLWILDVTGIRVVVLTADYAGTSAADRTALQAMVESIQITP